MRCSSGLVSALCAFTTWRWPSSHTCHERIDTLPSGWQYLGEASDVAPVVLRAYIKQPHKEYLQIAEAVSDPASPRYGQHLSAEELVLAVPSTHSSSDSLIAWLHENDVRESEVANDWVEFVTTVGQANDMLGTKFASYQYLGEDPVLRTQHYSIPTSMTEHIDFIYPTIHFFSPQRPSQSTLERRQHIPTGPANCSNSVCPPQLKSKYHISYVPKDNRSGSKIGIAGFLDTFPNITDVKSFLTQYGINKASAFPQYNVVSIQNGRTSVTPNQGSFTVEPELDLDYSIAFTGPLNVTFFSTGGRGTQLSQPGNKPVKASDNEPYLAFLEYILAQKAPPQVISISYSDDEQSVPEAYAKRVCDLFAQAAMRGISIIDSSGDSGADGSGGTANCIGPDGKRRLIPTFPASCPWVTSVGATADFGGAASYSSGGFSNYFARPAWQNASVAQYIKELNGAHKGLYNASGRGIPDVSLLGDNYLTLTGGVPASHDGTSASAPVFAAMIALINDIRLRNHKPALGYLNPLLYAAKAQTVFRDVADGSQTDGCSDGNFIAPGWQALKGWDAATGLGEPNFEKLRTLLA